MSALQMFPALDQATEDALRESIKRFGVLVPITKDQHGRILDGHHRSRIADEEGVDYRVDFREVESDEEAEEIATALNAVRRQLSKEQRKEIAAALREKGHSLRAIAAVTGVDEKQVRNDLAGADLSAPETVIGQDGKKYPAKKKPTVVTAKNKREADKAQDSLDVIEELPAGVLDTKQIARKAREAEAEKKRAEPTEEVTRSEDVTVIHGDLREVLGDYDLTDAVVISDPPYPKEFIPLWGEMANVMHDAGCRQLVLMSGNLFLPDILAQLEATDWQYRWLGAYLMPGAKSNVWGANVRQQWKPIIVYDRDGTERDLIQLDLFRSDGDDKTHHYWGQNEQGFAQIVETFSEPRDLVVDPFLGGGTTAIVARDLGRRFIGCDVDAAAIADSRSRLEQS